MDPLPHGTCRLLDRIQLDPVAVWIEKSIDRIKKKGLLRKATGKVQADTMSFFESFAASL